MLLNYLNISQTRAFARLALATVVICPILVGCKPEGQSAYQGYVDSTLTYLASPSGGKLIQRPVKRGTLIKAGALLAQLDPEPEQSSLAQAKAELAEAIENYKDRLTGQRTPAILQIEAKIAQAEATLELNQKHLLRSQQLFAKGTVGEETLDESKSVVAVNTARVAELNHALVGAKLPGRNHQIAAARAAIQAAEANIKKLQWHLAQKTLKAPFTAQVFDTYYQPGELVPASQSVLSLFTPNVKDVIFFVPEAALAKLALGKKVQVNCDGCAKPTNATITYLSPNAEYTPPVIYSRTARSKLIYRVHAEITGASAKAFHNGQPVDVEATLG